jgi:1,4-alpha-glucan branching enzyme
MRRVHAMPFGAQITDEGVRFALWAPTAREVSLVLDGQERPMPAAATAFGSTGTCSCRIRHPASSPTTCMARAS